MTASLPFVTNLSKVKVNFLIEIQKLTNQLFLLTKIPLKPTKGFGN